MSDFNCYKSSKVTARSGLLLSLIFLLIFAGCAITAPEEQLVTATLDQIQPRTLLRSEGSCGPGIFSEMLINKPSSASKLSPENISVLDWNIYKGQRRGWQEDLNNLGKEKDLILLQEAPLKNDLQIFFQKNSFNWNLNSAFSYRSIEFGVLIASKVEPLTSCGLRQKEPIIGLPKTVLVSIFEIAGSFQKLLVANVHGINFTLGIKSYQAQLNSIVTILEQHEGPIIVAGDFNNWSQSRSKMVDLLVKKISLTMLRFENDKRTMFYGNPVDHILYRGLVPVSHNIVPINSSDHNAISVSFRLKKIKD